MPSEGAFTAMLEGRANAPERSAYSPGLRLCTTCKHYFDVALAFQGERKTCKKCSKRKALQARKRRRDKEEHTRSRSVTKSDDDSNTAPSMFFQPEIRLRWIEDSEED